MLYATFECIGKFLKGGLMVADSMLLSYGAVHLEIIRNDQRTPPPPSSRLSAMIKELLVLTFCINSPPPPSSRLSASGWSAFDSFHQKEGSRDVSSGEEE